MYGINLWGEVKERKKEKEKRFRSESHKEEDVGYTALNLACFA